MPERYTTVVAIRSTNTDILPWDALSGQYQLHPGTPCSVVGQRPVMGAGRLGHLLRGQRGEQISRTLTSVFTLCAHAHRRTARLALAAAHEVLPDSRSSEPPVLLYIETARDHLRSIALDWPQRLSDMTTSAQDMAWLHDCPLALATTQPITNADAAWDLLARLRTWLEQRILGQSVVGWLATHRDSDQLANWCHAQATLLAPARWLSAWHPIARALKPGARCLEILDADTAHQTAQLRQLVQSMLDDPGFIQRPTWLGECAENGPWTRLRHRQAPAPTPLNAWTRLSARWIELLEIAAADPRAAGHDNAPLLASGALKLGGGQALAWCEMARGLLLHWVQLDGNSKVQDYRVLAPTEWNFHPEGALARALAALSPQDAAAARTLAAAYDPCVACSVHAASGARNTLVERTDQG